MKKIAIGTALSAIVITAAVVHAQQRPEAQQQVSEEVQATLTDIRETLGTVPVFMRLFPQDALPGAWEETKAIQLGETALSGRHKELIGIGVASQIPCNYCSYFHTEAAKLHGASDAEVREAIAIAAVAYKTNTYAIGMQIDPQQLRQDTARATRRMQEMTEAAVRPEGDEAAVRPEGEEAAPVEITDARTARQDIERTLGFVPTFYEAMPDAAVPGVWKAIKAMHMTETEVPGKVGLLISVAVASQSFCTPCIHHYTELAKAQGATEQEIGEAVAMAALVRQWSTVLNGNLVDEAEFKRETDQIMNHVRSAAEAARAPTR